MPATVIVAEFGPEHQAGAQIAGEDIVNLLAMTAVLGKKRVAPLAGRRTEAQGHRQRLTGQVQLAVGALAGIEPPAVELGHAAIAAASQRFLALAAFEHDPELHVATDRQPALLSRRIAPVGHLPHGYGVVEGRFLRSPGRRLAGRKYPECQESAQERSLRHPQDLP